MKKEEKRALKEKRDISKITIRLAEKMIEDAKNKLNSHVVTVVRQTVPCWERMSSEDE